MYVKINKLLDYTQNFTWRNVYCSKTLEARVLPSEESLYRNELSCMLYIQLPLYNTLKYTSLRHGGLTLNYFKEFHRMIQHFYKLAEFTANYHMTKAWTCFVERKF